MIKNYKKYIIWLVVIGLTAWGIVAARKSNAPTIKEVMVQKGDIRETVQVTGKIQSSKDANMSFNTSGLVSKVYIKEGDAVRPGQRLIALNSGNAYASVLEARANLEAAQATLLDLQDGSRKEDIATKQASVSSAEGELDNAYRSTVESIKSSYTQSNDAIHVKTKDFFRGSVTDGYKINFNSCDFNAETQAETKRANIEVLLSTWKNEVSNLDGNQTGTNVEQSLQNAYSYTSNVRDVLLSMEGLINSSCNLNDSSYDTLRSNSSSAKTSVNSVLADLAQKKSLIISTKNNLTIAQKNLNLIEAGTEVGKIRNQQALVKSAQARVAQAEAELNKYTLISPISGTVTKIDITEGELATVGKQVLRIIGSGSFQIEASVTENDVAQLKKGNVALVKIDALDEEEGKQGVVTSIDAGENSTDGTPLYKVIISLTETDERIRSGMSADVTITTKETKDVLRLPFRFVQKKEGAQFVSVLIDKAKKTTEERTVRTGARSTDGYVEVLSGLKEGETVIENQSTSTSTQK